MRESFEEIYGRCKEFYNNVKQENDLLSDFKDLKKNLFDDVMPDKSYSIKEIEKMCFSDKDAILLVGEEYVGKTHFARNFLKKCPEFEYFSFDRAFDLINMQRTYKFKKLIGAQSNLICAEMMEEFVQTSKGKIIIDGYLIEIPFRAALIKFLKQYGFKIHVVHFTLECVVRHVYENICKAMLERVLYERYVKGFETRYIEEKRYDDLFYIEDHIMELVSKKRKMTYEEIYNKYMKEAEVQKRISKGIYFLNSRIHMNYVFFQELLGFFCIGCDFLYVVNEMEEC